MLRKIKIVVLLLLAVILLGGCSMLTVEQMYCLPKRSEDYKNLQTAIENAMTGLSFCAPLAGEIQQPVQMADLDGDGINEYLLFAKATAERPLRILLFRNIDGAYVHTDTVESNGTAFDCVEYVKLDNQPGLEVIVGRQVSDQLQRSVSAYTFNAGAITQVLTVNYTKFLTLDLDKNGISELLIVKPGIADTDNGIVEMYSMNKGTVERSNEVSMSRPADNLKRIIVGKLHGGSLAVYVASTVGDNALITDIFTVRSGLLTNVTHSSTGGTSIQTMRNFYVYADDLDNDGVVELPSLLTMKPISSAQTGDKYHMVRWYAMTPEGDEVDKMYTFHNFVDGWYLQVDRALASRMTVDASGNEHAFYMWDVEYKTTRKVMTIYAFSPQDKDEMSAVNGLMTLNRSDSMIYAVTLESAAVEYGISRDELIYSFRLIQKDWNTGET